MTEPSMTLAEKIIARAAGRKSVRPGEIVTCKVDLAMIHDASGPRRLKPVLERLGVPPWDVSRIVLITDHYVPATDEITRKIGETNREFVQRYRMPNFYDGEGICHVVLPERGHLKPGMFVAGGDSHSPTGGAFGAFMFGIGATDMAGVVVTGETWIKVPETIEMEWTGQLAPGVTAKDMMLFLCAEFGMEGARAEAVHYTGSAITALPMQERMTLANMTTEIGGIAGLISPDDTTADFIRNAGAEPGDIAQWQSDRDAMPVEKHSFDASSLEPHVAAPHSPANSAPISDYGSDSFEIAYIGACTGAKLVDLQMAAQVLKGRKAARNVKLLVAPASRKDQEKAAADGTLQILQDAGAELLPNACGICSGYGAALDDNVRCLSTTARNFKGRMGAPSSEVYLASPYTVAASAVAGRIADPRQFLNGDG